MRSTLTESKPRSREDWIRSRGEFVGLDAIDCFLD